MQYGDLADWWSSSMKIVCAATPFPRASGPTLEAVDVTNDNNINGTHFCKIGTQERFQAFVLRGQGVSHNILLFSCQGQVRGYDGSVMLYAVNTREAMQLKRLGANHRGCGALPIERLVILLDG